VSASDSDIASGAVIEHAIRRNQFIHAMGGPVGTAGRGAVALRCDHGLRAFRDRVLPELRARNIPVAQAYNPHNWHYEENDGVTPTELDSWVRAGDVEIWNHTRNHLGVRSMTEAVDQIAGALTTIADELPSARGQVWGFAPPSVSHGDYLGYRNGGSPSQWSTEVGQLVLRHHAVASGYLPGTAFRVLDGRPRDGLGHVTIERFTADEIIAKVDDAVARRRGFQMMLHPSQLDRPGKLSTPGFVAILDHVAALRDAGRLEVLSPYRLLLADASLHLDPIPDWIEFDSGATDVKPPVGCRARRRGDTVEFNVTGIRARRSGEVLGVQPLPPWLRPRHTQFGVLMSDSGQVARMNVDAEGSISLSGGGSMEKPIVGILSTGSTRLHGESLSALADRGEPEP